jgi:hypothetical protein
MQRPGAFTLCNYLCPFGKYTPTLYLCKTPYKVGDNTGYPAMDY